MEAGSGLGTRLLYVILRLYCQYINVSIVIPPQRQHYIYIYLYIYIYIVTRAQVRYLRQWVEGKTPPAQVTMGETTTCASGVFVPIAEGETPPP